MTSIYEKALTRKPPKGMPAWIPPKGRLAQRKLTSLGFTSGIGSMLIGAREAGFSVLGNLEWRDYYRLVDAKGRNTFVENFPGAWMARGWNDLDLMDQEMLRDTRVDLAMGHPECGLYSSLNGANKNAAEQKRNSGDIPLFLDYVAKFRPRFFVMDDLPDSFQALPMSAYVERLPDYDLFPEWISNYHYGNPQKNRKRMFMIGALKTEGYVFVPGELDGWVDWTVRERIEDLEGKYGVLPNHDDHTLTAYSSRFIHMRFRGDRPNWGEVAEHYLKVLPPLKNLQYYKEDGVTLTERPSLARMKYDHSCWVITGGNPLLHPVTALPLSIRERARLQGFPDDFVFYGTKLDEDGKWEHNNHNMWMVKQTGKAMPVEFNRYVAKQIKAHIEGRKFKTSGQRFLKPNPRVDYAKQQFCKLQSYANQEAACSSCWLIDSCSLSCKVGGRQVPIDLEDILR